MNNKLLTPSLPTCLIAQRTGDLMNQTIEKLWKFVRGDFSTLDFENWVYTDKGLEEMLGEEDYLELISVNYKSNAKAYEARQKIQEYLSRFLKIANA